MMKQGLPKKLLKEPLLDAIFECRFKTKHPLSNILPGFLYSALEGDKKLERLPHSDIPDFIRTHDPNFQYIPLVRVYWNDYNFLIGDQSIVLACSLPYKGWEQFKKIIIDTVDKLNQIKLIDSVSRYSIKYVNLIPSKNLYEQAKLVNLTLRIGHYQLEQEAYQVKMETQMDGFINVIQIISGARVTKQDKTSLEGVVIDIDTIKNIDNLSLSELKIDFSKALDHLHEVNKSHFFNCLTEQTLLKLEPEYE